MLFHRLQSNQGREPGYQGLTQALCTLDIVNDLDAAPRVGLPEQEVSREVHAVNVDSCGGLADERLAPWAHDYMIPRQSYSVQRAGWGSLRKDAGPPMVGGSDRRLGKFLIGGLELESEVVAEIERSHPSIKRARAQLLVFLPIAAILRRLRVDITKPLYAHPG
jgi:hypothetical protein